MQKVHPRWKFIGKGDNRRKVNIKLEHCVACKKKCLGCKLPFTTSTSEDERYCSEFCRQYPRKDRSQDVNLGGGGR